MDLGMCISCLFVGRHLSITSNNKCLLNPFAKGGSRMSSTSMHFIHSFIYFCGAKNQIQEHECVMLVIPAPGLVI